MKVRRVKFYQAIEFGKNKAITYLDIAGYKSVIYLAYLDELELEVVSNGIKMSANNQDDVVIPFNNIAFYAVEKEAKQVSDIKKSHKVS